MIKPKIVFMPGCFDSLDVNQEELDKIMSSIEAMIADGTLFHNARVIEEDDPRYDEIQKMIESGHTRKLQ